MLRNLTIVLALILSTAAITLADTPTQYARFRYHGSAFTFQSAEKTLSAAGRDVIAMYKIISGKEWTTDSEAKGGVLELALLDALSAQGWEVVQMTYRDEETIYLLKKPKKGQ